MVRWQLTDKDNYLFYTHILCNLDRIGVIFCSILVNQSYYIGIGRRYFWLSFYKLFHLKLYFYSIFAELTGDIDENKTEERESRIRNEGNSFIFTVKSWNCQLKNKKIWYDFQGDKWYNGRSLYCHQQWAKPILYHEPAIKSPLMICKKF